jgi:hypothetical protein
VFVICRSGHPDLRDRRCAPAELIGSGLTEFVIPPKVAGVRFRLSHALQRQDRTKRWAVGSIWSSGLNTNQLSRLDGLDGGQRR